ncbi:hypothetical protein A2U01_0085546, partial [Trifolium medium]|nr:hypothetical protein [Trifolium medium]
TIFVLTFGMLSFVDAGLRSGLRSLP